MYNLLMISGFGARLSAEKKTGAFYNTLEEFHKHWDRIDVLAPGKKWWFSKQKEYQLFNNVFVHTSPLPVFLHPFWINKKGKAIIKKYKSNLFTVQEHPPFYNGMGARLLNKSSGLPYMLEIHHIPGYPRASDIKEQFYLWLTKKYIAQDSKHAKKVRVVNKKQAYDFLCNVGVDKNKINYIPSMYIDLDKFYKKEEIKKYDVIAIARLVENKGLILLLDALTRVKKIQPDFKAIIVGTGPLEKKLKTETQNLGLENNIEFAGWVEIDREIELLNQSKMLVITSFNEGGPRVALEAMACGVPVITTRVGLMLDIITDKYSGLFIEWNSSNIAEQILLLLNDLQLQQKLSNNGLNIVRNFEKKHAIENYAKELQKLA